jgi:hypothetical protein
MHSFKTVATHGYSSSSGKKYSNIFNDYLDLLDGVARAEDELNWQLNNYATAKEFESWKRHMQQGFTDALPMIKTWTIQHVGSCSPTRGWKAIQLVA